MSSNRCERDCAWCGGRVVPDDPNCGDYYQDAHCEDFLAQYGQASASLRIDH